MPFPCIPCTRQNTWVSPPISSPALFPWDRQLSSLALPRGCRGRGELWETRSEPRLKIGARVVCPTDCRVSSFRDLGAFEDYIETLPVIMLEVRVVVEGVEMTRFSPSELEECRQGECTILDYHVQRTIFILTLIYIRSLWSGLQLSAGSSLSDDLFRIPSWFYDQYLLLICN